jgi:hypothetical protein
VLIGALWLLVPGVGWVFNMGHRIVLVHHMLHGEPAWPAWTNYGQLFRHGATTLVGMLLYYSPGAALGLIAWRTGSATLAVASAACAAAATIAIPGFMSHYCREYDAREIFDPLRALTRCLTAGRSYWHAWGIALAALASSFSGLALAGVGFLVTSVWFWQVAGIGFATVMARTHGLSGEAAS